MPDDRDEIDQPTALRRLFYPIASHRSGDLAVMRRVLNGHGYDATYTDIELAFSDWSESEYAAGWVGISGMSDDELFAILWDRLEHDDGRDGTPREND